MPRLLSREEFDDASFLGECGLTADSWDEVLGEGWENGTDQEIYDRYVMYLTRRTKLGMLLTGVDE